MDRPLVSVIIPTYNRASLLREALDSVSRQTFRDFEVIVIDDGSTEPIADELAGHAVKPVIIRQPHQGPAAARNRGIAEATGDLIAFLDSDDLWLPEKLERFVSALQADRGTRIFYGPMKPISENGKEVPGRTKPCHTGRITEALFGSSFVHVPTVVCHKSVLLSAGGFDPSLPVCEDYDLWLRVSLDEPFGLIEEPLALRRLHPGRLSKSCMSRNLAVKAQVLRRFYWSERARRIMNDEAALARLARVFHVSAWASLRSGDFGQAVEMCRESRRCHAPALRNWPLLWGARLLSCFATNGHPRVRIADAPRCMMGSAERGVPTAMTAGSAPCAAMASSGPSSSLNVRDRQSH
jgi:glycosyltransferase involved in cell wall biosynthesis